MRAVSARREALARRSAAPRYIGVTEFAILAHVDVACLSRWHIHGPVWVPAPDVLLGAQRRAGWSTRCAREWFQGMTPYERPASIEYLDTKQMCEHQQMTTETLYACMDDGTVDEPAIWLDGKPGWLPPLGPNGNGES